MEIVERVEPVTFQFSDGCLCGFRSPGLPLPFSHLYRLLLTLAQVGGFHLAWSVMEHD